MQLVLWLIAVALGIFGIAKIFTGEMAIGIALIVLALLIGPGGVSIFT